MNKKTVLVGLSGGVDSTVTAHLLLEAGYEVTGAYMRLWTDCPNEELDRQRIDKAREAAENLGIPLQVLDLRESFYRNIVLPFIEEYKRGRTPNPCVRCNRIFKFDQFEAAAEGDFDYVATGHYARIIARQKGEKTVYELHRALVPRKDQSYVLYHLSQAQLARTLFPLGEYDKEDVREIARGLGFNLESLSDSQDICFISPERGYRALLEEHGATGEPGNFVTPEGVVLGRHLGIGNYTVGQRKHLGMAFGRRVFVSEIRPETNEVVIADAGDIMRDAYHLENVRFNLPEPPNGPLRCEVAARYQAKPVAATVVPLMEDWTAARVDCDESQRAPTPGQTAVFYDGTRCLGGGTICYTLDE